MHWNVAWLGLFLLNGGIRSAEAQSPPPDTSAAFFTGEWIGTGEHGTYCYVKLNVAGSGWVLLDAGAGDWNGAGFQWRNQRQSLQITQIAPLRRSPQYRLMPLASFQLRSEFNQTLHLTWATSTGSCHLQKIETMTRHLDRARGAIGTLPPREGSP